MKQAKLKFLLFDNYLNIIKKSAGSKIFRELYFKIRERKIDLLNHGDLSCAFYASSILKLFSLVKKIHTTVKGIERELRQSGWQETKKPKPGSVIIWAPKIFKNGETHRHIGFYLGKGLAISNSSKKRSPTKHSWNFRPIEKILWNKKLK